VRKVVIRDGKECVGEEIQKEAEISREERPMLFNMKKTKVVIKRNYTEKCMCYSSTDMKIQIVHRTTYKKRNASVITGKISLPFYLSNPTSLVVTGYQPNIAQCGFSCYRISTHLQTTRVFYFAFYIFYLSDTEEFMTSSQNFHNLIESHRGTKPRDA
jgi:hypothetical protein